MQGRYEIISHVGSGTFGKVFKCTQRSSGRLVAIKELVKDKFRELVLQNEIDILQKLCRDGIHENHFIVQTLEIIEEPSRTCFVFELLDKSLYHIMKERKFQPLSLQEVRVIAFQLFSAIQRLSELSLLHTDVKPENIMLVNHIKWPFRIKLIDFGSASRMRTARVYQAPYIQSRFYRSPEILVGCNFGEAIDMWSVGCVLAEVSTGVPLYPGASEYDQIRYITDLQGNFPLSLLQRGKKTDSYFFRIHHPQCNNSLRHMTGEHYYIQPCLCEWRLKTTAEYKTETGKEASETRRVRFANLSHLALYRQTLGVSTAVPLYDDAVQHCDCLAFASLLQQMLALDPAYRIKPSEALLHNFITATHLAAYDHRSEYVKKTGEVSIKALGIPRIYRRSYTPCYIVPANEVQSPWIIPGTQVWCNGTGGFPCSYSNPKQNRNQAGAWQQEFLPRMPTTSAWTTGPPRHLQTQFCHNEVVHKFIRMQADSVNHTATNQTHILLTNNHRNTLVQSVNAVDNTQQVQPIYFPSSEIPDIHHMMTTNVPVANKKLKQPPEEYDSAIICSMPASWYHNYKHENKQHSDTSSDRMGEKEAFITNLMKHTGPRKRVSVEGKVIPFTKKDSANSNGQAKSKQMVSKPIGIQCSHDVPTHFSGNTHFCERT